jgi:hypothetical protein
MNRLKPYQIFLLFLLLFITVIIFLPSLNAGYAETDDWVMLKSYSGALKNISFDFVINTFKHAHEGLYHPLITLSYSFEITLFGFVPALFHFDNILLHLINIFLVFLIFFKLSNSFWLSFITTSLFAIHPTRAEVVCWISSRKDLLYTFFYLLSILFYIKTYDKIKLKIYLSLSLVMFLLSCLSKSMAITLPIVLILIDLYTNNFNKNKLKIYFLYLFFTFIFVFITFKTHYVDFSPEEFTFFNHFINFINAHFNILFYLDKLFLPINLYCMYPLFYDMSLMPPAFILYSPAILYLLIFFCFLSLKKTKFVFYGFIFFLVTILPVSGVFVVGQAMVADRYTYVPYIGLFFIFAKIIMYLYNRYNRYIKILIIVFFIALFTGLNYLTYVRGIDWEKSEYGCPRKMTYYEFGIKKKSAEESKKINIIKGTIF